MVQRLNFFTRWIARVLVASWGLAVAVLIIAYVVGLYAGRYRVVDRMFEGWWLLAIWLVCLGICARFLKR